MPYLNGGKLFSNINCSKSVKSRQFEVQVLAHDFVDLVSIIDAVFFIVFKVHRLFFISSRLDTSGKSSCCFEFYSSDKALDEILKKKKDIEENVPYIFDTISIV